MKYVLGVFGAVVVLIVAIILIARGPATPDNQAGDPQTSLAEFADRPGTVEYVMEGEVEAQEERRSIRFTVSRTERVIEVVGGYNDSVIERQVYSNDEAAYSSFIHALNHAGYSQEKDAEYESEEGVCPLGRRYIYSLRDGSEEQFRLWSTSCDRDDGSFAGNARLVRQLFQRQIPDYREVTSGVNL